MTESSIEMLFDGNALKLVRHDKVAVLTLDRPDAYNAVNDEMRAELADAIRIVSDDQASRALLITGAGKAFCAGGDIKAMEDRVRRGAGAPEAGWRRQRKLHESLEKLFHLDRPTLAAVNGPAHGLGLDLALTCDFVWSATGATLASSFVKSGLVPDGGSMFHLPRRVGLSRAKEMIFSGRVLAADEALSIGLVDVVKERSSLLEEAQGWLSEIVEKPAIPHALAKDILNRSFEQGLEQINVQGSQAQAFCYATPEHGKSVANFLARQARKTPK